MSEIDHYLHAYMEEMYYFVILVYYLNKLLRIKWGVKKIKKMKLTTKTIFSPIDELPH